ADAAGVLSVLLVSPGLVVIRHTSALPLERRPHPRVAPPRSVHHGGVTNRTSPVSEIMTAARVSVRPDDGVESAMRALVEHDVDAAPVVDADGVVVGMLSNSDLIVRESR